MKDGMTHWERVRSALKGAVTDRVPVSMWRHFYSSEQSAGSLAEAMLGFQKRFDWDFMKVNPRASYHVEGWGVEMKYDGDRSPRVVSTPIRKSADWMRLNALKPDHGVLGEQLKALEIISRGLKGTVPFLMTVFTPLAIAARLAPSEETFQRHLREHPDKVRHALDIITATFTDFSRACLERGTSGLFLATTAWGSANLLSDKEYRDFARPYDLKLLSALPPAEFHVLHICGERNLFRKMKDYPVHAFNWDVHGRGNPSLAEGSRILSRKMVIGGLSQGKGLAGASPQQLTGEVIGLRAAMGNRGWMLSPGCTFAPETPEANLRAVRRAVDLES